jgi:hypothetical protein
MAYQCWGEDKEDLTKKVEIERKRLEGETVVFYRLRGVMGRTRKRKGPRKVRVTCAKGHKNVFEVG